MDQDEADLVLRHDALCRAAAAGWARRLKTGAASYDDFLQEARLGLIEAARRYRPEAGEFSRYARAYIRGWLLHFVRDRLFALYEPRHRPNATRRAVPVYSLDDPLLHVDVPAPGPEERAEVLDLCQRGLADLPPRARQVLWLLACGWTQAAIARRLRISPRAVSRALGRLPGGNTSRR